MKNCEYLSIKEMKRTGKINDVYKVRFSSVLVSVSTEVTRFTHLIPPLSLSSSLILFKHQLSIMSTRKEAT